MTPCLYSCHEQLISIKINKFKQMSDLHFLKLHDFGFFDRVSFSWILGVVFHDIALLSYPLQGQQQQFVGKHDQAYRLGIVQEFVEGAEELLEL